MIVEIGTDAAQFLFPGIFVSNLQYSVFAVWVMAAECRVVRVAPVIILIPDLI
jgi:hypothetical protein